MGLQVRFTIRIIQTVCSTATAVLGRGVKFCLRQAFARRDRLRCRRRLAWVTVRTSGAGRAFMPWDAVPEPRTAFRTFGRCRAGAGNPLVVTSFTGKHLVPPGMNFVPRHHGTVLTASCQALFSIPFIVLSA